MGGSPGWGAMVRGWEVEVTGWAAEIQDRAAGSREGVERGGKGATELLWVVACVVLCNDLTDVLSQGDHPLVTFDAWGSLEEWAG